MNDLINPIFDAALERIVTPDEVKQAKAYARAASGRDAEAEQALTSLGRPK